MTRVPGKLAKLMAVVLLTVIGGVGLLETLRATAAQPVSPVITMAATGVASQPERQSGLLPHVIGTVPMPPGFAADPIAMDMNPTTGYAYLVGRQGQISVISNTEIITNISVGHYLATVATDETTGYTYIGSTDGPNVAVISGTQLVGEVEIDSSATKLLVVPPIGYAYAGSEFSDRIAVLSGTELITHVTLPIVGVNAMAANPANGWVYFADEMGNRVAVVSGTQIVGSVPIDSANALDVNPNTGYVYMGSPVLKNVVVLSGTMVVATVPLGHPAWYVKVNRVTGYVCVGNADGTVSVISGTQADSDARFGEQGFAGDHERQSDDGVYLYWIILWTPGHGDFGYAGNHDCEC